MNLKKLYLKIQIIIKNWIKIHIYIISQLLIYVILMILNNQGTQNLPVSYQGTNYAQEVMSKTLEQFIEQVHYLFNINQFK